MRAQLLEITCAPGGPRSALPGSVPLLKSPVIAKEGPRERLLRDGVSVLSDAELVAVLLSTGARRTPVHAIAAELLLLHGGLNGLRRVSANVLASTHGVGIGKATRILAAIELGSRVVHLRPKLGRSVRTSADLFAALPPQLGMAEVESFYAIALDAKNRPLSVACVAQGSAASCMVTPSDAFRSVFREAAVGVAFAHNHPSGDTEPSDDDMDLTIRLRRAGQLLGVHVIDHIIVGGDDYYSFVDAGLLPGEMP